jgi:phospholipid/cholesterol/gamma-HCH transport system permease protein
MGQSVYRPIRMLGGIERFGKALLSFVEELGGIVLLLGQTIRWLFRPPFRFGLFLRQMEFIGAGSFFIVSLTGTFTGLVLALQLIDGFGRFDAESLTGSTIAIALSREIGPVLTGLIVTGRVASAIATELGTMRVTEQIDALYTMAVNPIQYLVVPRVVAGLFMIPILTVLFVVLGMMGSYYVSVEMMGVDPGIYMRRINTLLKPHDITQGVVKSIVFSICITVVACYKGLNASGGAQGVGRATTQAVVYNFIAIFVLDYVLTVMMFKS